MILQSVSISTKPRALAFNSAVNVDAIFDALSHVPQFYPGFRKWFYGTVVPDLETTRRNIVAAIFDGEIAGIAIAKRGSEAKLCTLWVKPAYRRGGVACRLAEEAFDWIGTDKPIFSVPEELMPQFSEFVAKRQFQRTQKIHHYYRIGKAEHVFNGELVPQIVS